MSTAPIRKHGLGIVGAGVLALALTACGGGPDASSAPTDASVDDFCTSVSELDTADVDEFVDTLVETGTPEDIPEKARAGFEVVVEKAEEEEISSSEEDKVSEFFAYVALTCGDVPEIS